MILASSGWWIGGIILIIIWIALAFWPARVSRQGSTYSRPRLVERRGECGSGRALGPAVSCHLKCSKPKPWE